MNKEQVAVKQGVESLSYPRAVERLLADIRSVKERGTIRIFSGDATPSVYGHRKIMHAIRNARRERQALIQVVTGPVLLIDDRKRNPLLQLNERELVVEIYFRPHRGTSPHYRIVDTEDGLHLYMELAHEALVTTEDRMYLDFSQFTEARVALWAAKLAADFDSWVVAIRANPDPDLPILLTRKEAEELKAALGGMSRRYDYADIEIMRVAARQLGWHKLRTLRDLTESL